MSTSSEKAVLPPSHPHPSHVTSRIAKSQANDEPFWTLEFFPPKTTQGLANLYNRIGRMRTNLDPSWIHVTWGAGGTTVQRSLELAGRIQNGLLDPDLELVYQSVENPNLDLLQDKAIDAQLACQVCLHLTCTNVDQKSLHDTLEQAKTLGIRNILALRGDPPRGEEYWVATDNQFQYAIDLVRYIRKHYGHVFCIGVAGYPDGHADYVDTDVGKDMEYLKQKQDAGADFVVTQLFYNVDQFLSWYRQCRQMGITIPILPGIMPIQNHQSFKRMTNLCKANVPQPILDALEPIKSDDAAVRDYGVRLSIHMIGRIFLESDIRGFHLCTLNLEKSVERVLEGLGWKTDTGAELEDLSSISDTQLAIHKRLEKTKNQLLSDGNGCHTPKNLKVSTQEALRRTLARTWSSYQVPETTTWDEFPNGRYGDSRSPAYGEMDGYGVSLKVAPQDALTIWGHPVSLSDISDLFASYLLEKIPCIPWCDVPLMQETIEIRSHLLSLNLLPGSSSSSTTTTTMTKEMVSKAAYKGWWSVGSQPAVDGAPSSDPVVGFGPKGGYVFQKAFVELFMSQKDKDELIHRIDQSQEPISYFAGNRKAEFQSNLTEDQVNTVTWAVFPGKEIVQSTIIEKQSFQAWREEAFAIWAEWELLFPTLSVTRKLLKSIADERWLVTIVHHDYKNKDALWQFLAV